MINVVMPLLVAFMGYFKLRRTTMVKQVAETTGLSERAVSRVGDAVQTLLAPVDEVVTDETMTAKADAAVADALKDARAHDTQMNAAMPPLVEMLRGVVRPVITLTAFLWYVYARVNGIVLGDEDYALVGGIVAFWFGFRPFEKHSRLGLSPARLLP